MANLNASKTKDCGLSGPGERFRLFEAAKWQSWTPLKPKTVAWAAPEERFTVAKWQSWRRLKPLSGQQRLWPRSQAMAWQRPNGRKPRRAFCGFDGCQMAVLKATKTPERPTKAVARSQAVAWRRPNGVWPERPTKAVAWVAGCGLTASEWRRKSEAPGRFYGRTSEKDEFHTSGGPRRRPCLGQGRGRRIYIYMYVYIYFFKKYISYRCCFDFKMAFWVLNRHSLVILGINPGIQREFYGD